MLYYNLVVIFALLVVAHCYFDYAGQGDFMAKYKNPFLSDPIPGVPWYQLMGAHCIIHGGVVGIITGSVLLGIFEVIVHFITDYSKCKGKISYNTDQFIHIASKLIWVLLIPFFPLYI